MGTRSLTIFKDDDGQDIVVMYRQYDGYPDGGHGQELADYLKGHKVINGIGQDTWETAFNGMGCLAASVIQHFKTGIGNFYLYPGGTRDAGEEYIYTISRGEGGRIVMEVSDCYDRDNGKVFKWTGHPEDFADCIAKEKEFEESIIV